MIDVACVIVGSCCLMNFVGIVRVNIEQVLRRCMRTDTINKEMRLVEWCVKRPWIKFDASFVSVEYRRILSG